MEGKTVLVTGAARGIGRAIAERCATEGANVVLADVDEDECEETAERISESGRRATTTQLDVTDAEAFADIVAATVDEFGGLNILYNNAGVVHKATFEDTADADFEHLWAVNVLGTWNGCKAAVPVMKEQGGGAIVNVSSIGGLRGNEQVVGYCLTKGAVSNFTRALAVELGPDSIRVNAVCPGSIDHEMKDITAVPDEVKAAETSLGRMGSVEEVAAAAHFLGSSDASFITGQNLVVDGGRIIQE